MSSQTDARLGARSHIGFNGQLHEIGGAWQLLGNGYRAYNPTLMRFSSPDTLSPFFKGGLNAYAYCEGEPINRVDPSGRFAAYILPATFGLGAVVMGIGAAFAESPGVKAVTGALATIAVVGAAMTYPLGGGMLLSRLRSRGDPGRGMPLRQQWQPAKRVASTATPPSALSRSSLTRSNTAQASDLMGNSSVSPVGTAGQGTTSMPQVRYAGRGQRKIVEEGELGLLKPFDAYSHATAPRLLKASNPVRSSRAPVQVQKDIRRNRSGSFERLRAEERRSVLFNTEDRRLRFLGGRRFVDQRRNYQG